MSRNKIAFLAALPMIMIAIILYSNSLQTTFYEGRTTYLSGTNPQLVTIDSSGRPWVSGYVQLTSGGIYEGILKVLEGDSWILYTSGNSGLPGDRITSLASDHDGNMWIGTYESGLLKFDGERWTTFTKQNSGLASNEVEVVAVDPFDRVWIGYHFALYVPASGVTVFDGISWTTFTTNNSDLMSDEVSTISFDSENRAWLGTTEGISVFDGSEWITYSPSNSGLIADAISGIAFDEEGSTWIGTYGEHDGINTFDGEEWIYYSPEDIGFPGRGSSLRWLIPDILIDQSQRVWVWSGGGVRVFDGKNWLGLVEEDGGNAVSDLAADKQGRVWIANGGEDGGLVALDPEYPLASTRRVQPQRIFLSSGGTWYVALILVCLFIAVLLDSLTTVSLALLGGISVVTGWIAIFNDPHVVYFLHFVNPGVYATVGAAIGAVAGARIATRAKRPNRSRFVLTAIGLGVGLVIGICQITPVLFAQ
jgi:hypothetical protein